MKEYNLKLEIENVIDTDDIKKLRYIENNYPLVFTSYYDSLIEYQNILSKRISFIKSYNKWEKQ